MLARWQVWLAGGETPIRCGLDRVIIGSGVIIESILQILQPKFEKSDLAAQSERPPPPQIVTVLHEVTSRYPRPSADYVHNLLLCTKAIE